jgi:menaquinone-dependent protoporphyrinogen IX oxidase
MRNILLLYARTHGQTAKIARRLGETLRAEDSPPSANA